MIQDLVHKKIIQNCDSLAEWFDNKSKGLAYTIYTSFDIRDSGSKVAPVDANIFPAGFNNICGVDKESAHAILKKYLNIHYQNTGSTIALLTEEHTKNAYYWENVSAIFDIIVGAGYNPIVCIPRALDAPVEVSSITGKKLLIHSAENRNGELYVNDKKIDLIICNNDFSESHEAWSAGLKTPMNPPRELGWYRRRKHIFFQKYNELVEEFSQRAQINPKLLTVKTELYENFDINNDEVLKDLATRVDQFLTSLQSEYDQLGLKEKPFCFIKNNAGTYGLAVLQVHSGNEILEWTSKTKKKMKAAKGGREVTELIIQEGIATRYSEKDGGSAEPCVYMIGCALAGGFLRTHSEKGPEESLNSPGAVYKKLCMSDLQVDQQDCPMENVYGWAARLGALAVAIEAQSLDVDFKNYENKIKTCT